jgi:hypothetical protein
MTSGTVSFHLVAPCLGRTLSPKKPSFWRYLSAIADFAEFQMQNETAVFDAMALNPITADYDIW